MLKLSLFGTKSEVFARLAFSVFVTIAASAPVFAAKGENLPKCHVNDTVDTVCEINVTDLRPTQFAVGMREVKDKMADLHDMKWSKYYKYIADHPAPVVVGPDHRFYITDHHHLARALAELNMDTMDAKVEANYSNMSEAAFWSTMKKKNWVYLNDENGKPQSVEALVALKNIKSLQDDPYRSLASAVEKAGGFVKTGVPFEEFVWADYFRKNIKIESGKAGFNAAVDEGVKLAKKRSK